MVVPALGKLELWKKELNDRVPKEALHIFGLLDPSTKRQKR